MPKKPEYIYNTRGGRTVRLKIKDKKVVAVKPDYINKETKLK